MFALTFIFSMLVGTSVAADVNSIPENILMGSATAAYQVEGAWDQDGKGESIWDRLTHTHPEIYFFDNHTGDFAADSYHKYKEDVQALVDIGAQHYRFSISWPRIMPTGDITNINQKGIDYYNNLINELLDNNITPFVTLYHWDLPQALQDLGGWVNPVLVDYFEDYARVAFTEFGDRIGWFAHPIYSEEGDYPAVMKEFIGNQSKAEGRYRSRLPEFDDYWINYIKGTHDYYSLNHYTSNYVSYSSDSSTGYVTSVDPDWIESDAAGIEYKTKIIAKKLFQYVPKGFRKVINWISSQYNYPDIFITESGWEDKGSLNDTMRIQYLNGYLAEMLKAIHLDNCSVIGYTVWSLIDTIEWNYGHTATYGLYSVDYDDPERPRTPKASAAVIADIIKNRKIPEEYFQDVL